MYYQLGCFQHSSKFPKLDASLVTFVVRLYYLRFTKFVICSHGFKVWLGVFLSKYSNDSGPHLLLHFHVIGNTKETLPSPQGITPT